MYDLLRSIMNFYDLPKARQKLTLLASWIISTQELPSRVLSRCTADIVKFLKRTIRQSDEMALKMLQVKWPALHSIEDFDKCMLSRLPNVS